MDKQTWKQIDGELRADLRSVEGLGGNSQYVRQDRINQHRGTDLLTDGGVVHWYLEVMRRARNEWVQRKLTGDLCLMDYQRAKSHHKWGHDKMQSARINLP